MEYYRENEKNYYKTNSDSANLATFGTSILTERIDFPAVDIGGDLTWADYQNDGLLDFVVSGTNAQIAMLYPKTGLYKNNGDNDFNLITSDIPDLESSSSSWGDYNNDGYLDLLVSGDKAFTNYPSTILFKNNQNGTFSEATDVPLIGVNGGSAQWYDFDNDGNLDIIATGLSSDTYDAIDSVSYLIYRNNGDNTFSNPIHYRSTYIGTTYVSAKAFCADYNNDGLTDILVKSTYDGIKLFKNLGDFKFEEQANLPINGLNGIVVWGDYDNDGYPDLTISGAQSYLFKNDGKGSFVLIDDALPIIRKWTDFDNDGYWDFIFSDNSSSGILRNNGNGTFTEQTGIYLPQKDNASIASGDYDNDGDNDLLFSGESSPYVTKLFQNNLLGQGGLIKNSAPQAISGLTARLKPGYTILTWQPGYDNETPTKALTYNLKLWKKDSTNFIVSPNSDLTSGFRQIAQAGNMQMATIYDIRNLKSGTYFWQVQAVDGGFMGGAWSDTSSFIVNAAQAYFTADTVCLGISTSFTDNSYAYDGLVGWKWNFGDTTAYSTLQNPTHIYQFSGEHTVQLIVTNSSGKTDTVYNTILVKPIPIVSFAASNVCIGTTTTIVNETNVATVSSWNWNFGDGQSSIYANPGSHVYSSQGSYTISLFVAASNGCSASENRNIVVTTTPNATLSLEYGNPTFCKGDSVVYSVPLNSNYSYHWLRNNDFISETSSTIKVKTESGDYKVIITNNLSNTCSATSDVKTISVNEAPAIPVINPESGTTFCQGDSVKINAGSILGVATWYRNEGTLTSTQNYFVAKETGSYTLKTTFANGCSSKPSLPVDVTVNPNPVLPSVSYGETTICQGSSVNFSTTSNSLLNFQWYRNNEIITDATSNLFSANESGDYWLQVSNSNQCKVKTSPVSVTVNELPDKPTIAEANNITNFCLGSEVELEVTNALSDLNYQWKRSGITIDGASLSSYKGKLAAGDYSVEVGQGNCSVESEILTLTTKPAPPKPNIYAWGPNVWIVVCDNTTAVDYRWYYNDQLLVGAKSNQYVAKQNLGDYFVEVNDGGECYTRSDIINIPTGGIVSGVEDLIGDAVTIYPNPTEGIVIVTLGNKLPGELKVEFLNALGSIVVEYRFNDSNGFSVDLARVPNGIYLCKIYYKNSVVAKKIVKQ
jgi:PKD repeat protein